MSQIPLQARRDSSTLGGDDVLEKLFDDDQRTGDGGIRCPRCRWQPGRDDRWMCLCGHSWNTFETRGKCPGCARQWLETQCLDCHAWSPHEDWYGEGS